METLLFVWLPTGVDAGYKGDFRGHCSNKEKQLQIGAQRQDNQFIASSPAAPNWLRIYFPSLLCFLSFVFVFEGSLLNADLFYVTPPKELKHLRTISSDCENVIKKQQVAQNCCRYCGSKNSRSRVISTLQMVTMVTNIRPRPNFIAHPYTVDKPIRKKVRHPQVQRVERISSDG